MRNSDFSGIDYNQTAGGITRPLEQLRKENLMNTLSNNAESYTPTKDKTETLEDGRTIQVAVAGVPLPRAEAQRLGLIKDETAEIKKVEPAANKSVAPTENKSKDK